MAYVSRDPFARQELHRTREYAPQWASGVDHCAWCGQARRTPGGRPYLYRYEVQTDGGRILRDDRLFCSKGCRDAYYG